MKNHQFLQIFKNSGIPENILIDLLESVRRSYVYSLVGSSAFYKILAENDKYQWPLYRLRIFSDKKSLIYRQAEDKKLVSRFIATILEEKKLRQDKSSYKNWKKLQTIMLERIYYYPQIYSFTADEMIQCHNKASRIQKYLDKMRKKKKNRIIRNSLYAGAGIASVIGGIRLFGKIKTSK